MYTQEELNRLSAEYPVLARVAARKEIWCECRAADAEEKMVLAEAGKAAELKEIPAMRERLAKGCVTDCNGECGDCTRFGTPIAIKGRLLLARGCGLPEQKLDDYNRIYVLMTADSGNRWCAVSAEVLAKYDNAYCFAAEAVASADCICRIITGELAAGISGVYSVAEEKTYARMAELKDEENYTLAPEACAAFEGLRYIMPGGEFFPAPDEDSAIIVWDAEARDLEFEEMLACYEKGKRQ